MSHNTSKYKRCSLAIESPVDCPSNNPLNAFLVYSTSSETEMGNSASANASVNSKPNAVTTFYTLHDSGSTTESTSDLHKSNSMPNMTPSPLNGKPPISNKYNSSPNNFIAPSPTFRRRVSLCDLNNFNDELRIINDSRKSSIESISSAGSKATASTKSMSNLLGSRDSLNSSHQHYFNPDFKFNGSRDSNMSIAESKTCRNHHRRNSIALKFENPKVID
ncbi:uncharacterized protein RJT21DRAFT_114751 [Scheffersomyces amazonensis]|uniref:uncharacterized protein n=1 Tax=Scheffersomyces amazonensis TaxID=1078765 RepID=UPI00315D22F8